MSRDYRSIDELAFEEVVGGRLRKYGIAACRSKDHPLQNAVLRRESFVHVNCEAPFVRFETFGDNDETNILRAVRTEFGDLLVNEDDCRFWGYPTDEAMFSAIASNRDSQNIGPTSETVVVATTMPRRLSSDERHRQIARAQAAFPFLAPENFDDDQRLRGFMMLLPEFDEPDIEFEGLVPCANIHADGPCLGHLLSRSGKPLGKGQPIGAAQCSLGIEH